MPVECLIPDDRLKLLLFCYGSYWKVEQHTSIENRYFCLSINPSRLTFGFLSNAQYGVVVTIGLFSMFPLFDLGCRNIPQQFHHQEWTECASRLASRARPRSVWARNTSSNMTSWYLMCQPWELVWKYVISSFWSSFLFSNVYFLFLLNRWCVLELVTDRDLPVFPALPVLARWAVTVDAPLVPLTEDFVILPSILAMKWLE